MEPRQSSFVSSTPSWSLLLATLSRSSGASGLLPLSCRRRVETGLHVGQERVIGSEELVRRLRLRILVTSHALSWLRPFLNEDPGGLLTAAVLPCRFLPAVGCALSFLLHVLIPAVGHALPLAAGLLFYPLWVRTFPPAVSSIHHVVLDLRLGSCSPRLLTLRRCRLALQPRVLVAIHELLGELFAHARADSLRSSRAARGLLD